MARPTEAQGSQIARTRLFLNDLRVHGPHGVYEEERLSGNDFSICVELEGDLSTALRSDLLMDSVDFDQIAKLIQDVHQQQRFSLIESFADAIAREIMDRFGVLSRVVVRVSKLTLHRLSSVHDVAVEIVRERG